jgi:hypothetical protein
MEFLYMFPVYIDSANMTSITQLAETDRIHELGMQLLQPHCHLMRASLAWLLLSHADELPTRLASQPIAFAAELQHVVSTSNAMMASTTDLRDETIR